MATGYLEFDKSGKELTAMCWGSYYLHEIEFMIQSRPGHGNGGGIGEHADGALDLCQVSAGNNCRWLVVNADLEASWTPVNKLDGSLSLDIFLMSNIAFIPVSFIQYNEV